ncbi:MAG: hypothetical protein HY235_15675 [Acidobacteria bacterium]|nr:hypothetical protein [Acidobacteriota bacterium]
MGPAGSAFSEHAAGLRGFEQAFEVVSVEAVSDALHLLRRGQIALMALYGRPQEPGYVELMVEGLSKERAPRILVFSGQSPVRRVEAHSFVQAISPEIGETALKKLAFQCCVAFDEPPEKAAVDPSELLLAVADFPDEEWLRLTNPLGQSGDLCIQGGRVVYCEAERLSGETAAGLVVSWKCCTLEYREFPSFLKGNMDCPVRDVALNVRTNSIVMLPVAAPAPDNLDPVAEEPEEMPSFAGEGAGNEYSVEEPLELLSLSGADWDGTEEPAALPEFDVPAWKAALPETRKGVFATVAVVTAGKGQLESCDPRDDSAYFDAAALREIYDQARLYAQRHRLGMSKTVQLVAGGSTIAVAPIPGGERLVAVRLAEGRFGAAEEAELKRLQEMLLLSYPVASV